MLIIFLIIDLTGGGTVLKSIAYAYLLSDYSKIEIKKSRSPALEFQDFPGISMVFQVLCLFPGLSKPGILNNKIPGLNRGLYEPCCLL